MANYSVNLTDNGNGSYTVTNVKRAPSTVASGGTELTTSFSDVASSNTWLALGDSLDRAMNYIAADKVKNG